MGNQVSKKRKEIDNRSQSSDSFNNSSTLSSNHPKFADEAYPHNDSEASRQQGEHYLLKHVFQCSYFAPIESILSKPNSKTLDIGCGRHASWMIDMANDFPNCNFYGFDIIEPCSLDDDSNLSIHIPDNCNLKKYDLFDGYPYENNMFDFVHQRTMHLIYHEDKIPWMFQEILRVTKDNGWIEFQEPDIAVKRAGPIFSKLFAAIRAYVRERLGRVLEGSTLVKRMKEHGLVDIKSDYGSMPICWGGYTGKLVYEDFLLMFQNIGPMIYEYLDMGEYDKDTYETLLDNGFNECVEHQTFLNVRYAYGRKPASSSR